MAVIKRVKGDNYPLEIQLLQPVSGNLTLDEYEPMDLTGATVKFTVKRNFQDPDANALIKVDTTVHSDPTNGITSFDLSSSNMDIKGEFYYDICVEIGGQRTSVQADRIIFTDNITLR